MKLGIIISAALVIIIGAALFFGLRGVADLPTRMTAPERLKKIELPASLPPIWESADPSAKANERYREAIDYALNTVRDARRASDREKDKLTDLVIRAMDAGEVERPFLDDLVPVKLNADPAFGAAIDVIIPQTVLTRAEELAERGDTQRAIRAGKAVFALGERAYRHSERVLPRWYGLNLMMAAGSLIHEVSEDEDLNAGLRQWALALQDITKEWRDYKLPIVKNVNPHVGDLINMARKDQDPTFRIEAVLQLGSVKFAPGSRGNKRAIEDAIEDARSDPDPRVVEAAKAAEAFTLEERRRLH